MLWPLQRALFERWSSDPELQALIDGRIFDGLAPSETEYPYVRIEQPTEVPGLRALGSTGWSGTITAGAFSRYEGGAEVLGSVVPAMHAALADPLEVEGYGTVRLKPEFTTLLVEEESIRHAPVRYRATAIQQSDVLDPPIGWDAAATRGLSMLVDVAQLGLADGTLVSGFTEWGPHAFLATSTEGSKYTYRTNQLNGAPVLEGDGFAVLTVASVDLHQLASVNEFSAYFLLDADWLNATSYALRLHSDEGRITFLLTGAALGFKCGLTYQTCMSTGLIDFGSWPIIEAHKSGANAEILVNGVLVASTSIFEPTPSGTGVLGLLGSMDGANYGWQKARYLLTATVNHTEAERAAIRNGLAAVRGF